MRSPYSIKRHIVELKKTNSKHKETLKEVLDYWMNKLTLINN